MSETENKTQGQKPKTSLPRILKIMTITTIITIVIFLAIIPICDVRQTANQVICGMNLAGCRSALQIYRNGNNNKYPKLDEWCDLINEYVLEDGFVCLATSGIGERCSYAINPNCEPNSPNDVVLLFESKDGWNQFGGAELLNPENHKGKGCSVMFNNFDVEFVLTEELDKLKWK